MITYIFKNLREIFANILIELKDILKWGVFEKIRRYLENFGEI